MPMTASVTVHVDKDGAMAITQNPTLAPAVQKSKHEPKAQETDVRVSSDTVKDATVFLETFFKLYPTAAEKELLCQRRSACSCFWRLCIFRTGKPCL